MCVTVDSTLLLPARCLFGTIPAHAGGVGDPFAVRGADCGSVHEERACACSG